MKLTKKKQAFRPVPAKMPTFEKVTQGEYGLAVAGNCGEATTGERGIALAGGASRATSGDEGTSISGHHGKSFAGKDGEALSGDWGLSEVEGKGIAAAGVHGTVSAGKGSIIQLMFHSEDDRLRIKTGYIGEGGLKPNTRYHLNDANDFEEEK